MCTYRKQSTQCLFCVFKTKSTTCHSYLFNTPKNNRFVKIYNSKRPLPSFFRNQCDHAPLSLPEICLPRERPQLKIRVRYGARQNAKYVNSGTTNVPTAPRTILNGILSRRRSAHKATPVFACKPIYSACKLRLFLASVVKGERKEYDNALGENR